MEYQITYEDALRICKAYKNFNFYKTEHMFGNYKVVTFNYFLCEYRYFVIPLREAPEINAKDMRGVTFVFNEDGTLYKRFLMLPKFFNVNQVEETQLNVLKEKKIKHVTIKEDGSLIAFMQLPNGEVFAKTQGGFTNDQAVAAMKLYNEQECVKEFVDMRLRVDNTPLFEYVSYDNRIVLKYTTKELRLIGIRDNEDGEYTSAATWDFNKIPQVKTMKIESLSELEELMKTSTDMEGVVVEFEDGQLVKWKTAWYFNLHGIRTMNIFREDFVINNYLTEKLDDVTQELNHVDDADAFKFIEVVKTAVNNWSNYIEVGVDALVKAYKNENSFYFNNWAKFATDCHKAPYFGLARNKIENPEEYVKYKIGYMLNAAKHLNQAKKIVEKFKDENTCIQ
jgi:T4 RnlA family RNA ligase